DGEYEFYVIATDRAGNAEAPPAEADTATLYDSLAPASSCVSPEYANESPIVVDFSATDALSGIAEVALWFRFDGGAWTNSGLTAEGESGSFDFNPESGDGEYEFYVIATDAAGNVENAPTTADTTTLYDTTPPGSSCTSPEYENGSQIQVAFTCDDPDPDNATVVLYYRYGELDWADTGLSASGASGTFQFTPADGDGTYEFYTLATDAAENGENPPETADSSTIYDTTAPYSAASSPQSVTSAPFNVEYTNGDETSGVAQTDLWYRLDEGAWTLGGTWTPDTKAAFSFDASEGPGTYDFYTIATDFAGNVEDAPAQPDSTTIYSNSGPRIWVSDDSIEFGEVNVGQQGSQTLTIRNDGSENLQISDISPDDEAFDASTPQPLPITLAPDAQVEVEVIFEPDEAGLFEATLSISSNDGETPTFAVDLTGEGIAVGGLLVEVSANADAYAFEDGFSMNISVENTGDAVDVDIYVALTYDLNGPEQRSWSAALNSEYWTEGIVPLVADYPIANGFSLSMPWWGATIPTEFPRIAKSGTYTLQMAAVEPGTLNFVSNYSFDEFILNGRPFVDIETDAESYNAEGDTVRMQLDIYLPPYSLTTDYYLLMLGPDGEFWSPASFGTNVLWTTGAAPVLPYFGTPPDVTMTLDAVVTELPASAPFDMSGQFLLFSALVEPGTLTPFSDIGTATFTLD
ncbi:MAG: choice-of-anchor D domain-containing protein, partial [Candidatus Coatesbacteria bacterium]|nr:choice-of-anchor D domain-containing protein [Candidatus Coatesbacteria bacterium]